MDDQGLGFCQPTNEEWQTGGNLLLLSLALAEVEQLVVGRPQKGSDICLELSSDVLLPASLLQTLMQVRPPRFLSRQ